MDNLYSTIFILKPDQCIQKLDNYKFTFYYIYIKTHIYKCFVVLVVRYLHSTIFILKLKTTENEEIETMKFTFYYIYIKTQLRIERNVTYDRFTFYYIYIKTGSLQMAIFQKFSTSKLSITNYSSIIFIKNQY